jgi:hypothetical protein
MNAPQQSGNLPYVVMPATESAHKLKGQKLVMNGAHFPESEAWARPS